MNQTVPKFRNPFCTIEAAHGTCAVTISIVTQLRTKVKHIVCIKDILFEGRQERQECCSSRDERQMRMVKTVVQNDREKMNFLNHGEKIASFALSPAYRENPPTKGRTHDEQYDGLPDGYFLRPRARYGQIVPV